MPASSRARPPEDPADRQRSPLFCSAAQYNPDIARLLLERGARPDDDHMLYLAAFADDHECLRLLLPYAPDIAHTTALSAPLSTGDVTGVRILLDAGADPNHLLDAGELGESHEGTPPVPPLSAAIALDCAPSDHRSAPGPRRRPQQSGAGRPHPVPGGRPQRARPSWPGYWRSTVPAPISPPPTGS